MELGDKVRLKFNPAYSQAFHGGTYSDLVHKGTTGIIVALPNEEEGLYDYCVLMDSVFGLEVWVEECQMVLINKVINSDKNIGELYVVQGRR